MSDSSIRAVYYIDGVPVARSEEPAPEVPVVARLYHPARSLRVDVRMSWKREHVEGAQYMWTEGNYACDCNRRNFIAEELGEKHPAENPCGDTIVLEKLTVDGEDVFWRPQPCDS